MLCEYIFTGETIHSWHEKKETIILLEGYLFLPQVWFHNPVFRSAMYKYISPTSGRPEQEVKRGENYCN